MFLGHGLYCYKNRNKINNNFTVDLLLFTKCILCKLFRYDRVITMMTAPRSCVNRCSLFLKSFNFQYLYVKQHKRTS